MALLIILAMIGIIWYCYIKNKKYIKYTYNGHIFFKNISSFKNGDLTDCIQLKENGYYSRATEEVQNKQEVTEEEFEKMSDEEKLEVVDKYLGS